MAFDSTQSVEIVSSENSHELEMTFEMRCTVGSFSGCFNPMTGYGEPPSGPEFEVESVTIQVPKVNYKGEVTGYADPLTLTWEQFTAIVGNDIADELFEDACEQAADSGDF